MTEDRFSHRNKRVSSVASLDSAVPAQEPAKSLLRTEFSVFLAQRGEEALPAQPVVLWANRPGRVPTALVRGLAEEAGLPWIEVPAGQGFCLEQVVSQLARRTARCREHHPLGVVVLTGLEQLAPAAVELLASHLGGPGLTPHVHQGRVVNLCRQQVFWVGTVEVREPSRQGGKAGHVEGGASFALLAVGPSSADVVAAGVAGPLRAAGREAEQAETLAALGKAFSAHAWLLPGTLEDLEAWARAEAAPWWPGRRVRAYCGHHGVTLRMGPGAVEAWAAEASRLGGTIDALEDRLRAAMEPVLAGIADHAHDIEAAELTPEALALTEAPRLVAGPRTLGHAMTGTTAPGEGAECGFERPPRTPQSSPDVRLARAEDLAPLFSNDSIPETP
jgi:hypothetical protein